MQTTFSNQFIQHLRQEWKRSRIALNVKPVKVEKTDEELKNEKIDLLVNQLVELSDYSDKVYLSQQIKKTLNNPIQVRKSDRVNFAEFRIDIDQTEVQSKVNDMESVIERVKLMRSQMKK